MTKSKCAHKANGETMGQPWSPRLGFVYDDEVRMATEVRCLYCGDTLSVVDKQKAKGER